MNTRIFLYGQFCDDALLESVLGRDLDLTPARLDGHTALVSSSGQYAVLAASADQAVRGMLVAPNPTSHARLEAYCSAVGLVPQEVAIFADDADHRALAFVPADPTAPLGPFNLGDWQARFGPVERLVAGEVLEIAPLVPPEGLRAMVPQMRMRAATRLRAGREPSPKGGLPTPEMSKLLIERSAQPYTDYFAVREDWMAFPTFDGDVSPVVKRASFMGGDAVTVLPYDPARDTVLFVRQFRHGPYARGDTNPWTLEPAAGRIDPDETPEDTARRELLEETGITSTAVHFVGRYYPSPGAYSELLYSYVAVADLASEDGGIGGLESEAEDIMRHVVPFSDAMEMVASGVANTGPLVLSLLWLAANRERLIRRAL